MGITFLHSIILGIAEGITEFAPVSSTAHILVTAKLLGITNSDFFTVFTVAIQSGSILAAVVYFWKTIWGNLSLIPKVIVGFIPAAVVGLLIHSLVTKLFGSTWIIAATLILGGIVFLFLKPIDTIVEVKKISYKQAFLIGCTQIVAMIPGVSRSGATLIGGTLLGIPRSQIVAFSFILGIPTILGATVVELHSLPHLALSQWTLIGVGTVVAFITALLTIKWFTNILTKKPLSWFGWYRIALGVLILIFVV
jgi:undecaprenyl-diphosphatase